MTKPSLLELSTPATILTQRDVRIGDADHRVRQTRQLRRQIVLAADRVSLYPRRDEGASDGNRRNMNVACVATSLHQRSVQFVDEGPAHQVDVIPQ